MWAQNVVSKRWKVNVHECACLAEFVILFCYYLFVGSCALVLVVAVTFLLCSSTKSLTWSTDTSTSVLLQRPFPCLCLPLCFTCVELIEHAPIVMKYATHSHLVSDSLNHLQVTLHKMEPRLSQINFLRYSGVHTSQNCKEMGGAKNKGH